MDQYSREFIAEKARLRPEDPTRAPQGRTATRPRPVRPTTADWADLDQRDFERQTGAASCLLLILAAIIYWQIREIDRVLGSPHETEKIVR